jgi:hypothetical protein
MPATARAVLPRSGLLACLGLVLACLPPATIETPLDPALGPPPPSPTDPSECRALISERSDRGPLTHELRWNSEGLRPIVTHRGLVVGTAEDLYALRARRQSFDPAEIFSAPEGLRCEQAVLWARQLPDGIEEPLVEALPACVGEVDGERVELESTLELLSVVGPLLAWRVREEGWGPDPIGTLDYRTIDLRTSQQTRPQAWLAEPSETMSRANPDHGACTQRDAPRSLARARGFALVWDAHDRLRLRVGYACCSWEQNHGMCELDDPLPRPDPELEAFLPDEDGLLHSPFGCGSIGLDGSVRTRDGARVGEHPVRTDTLLGVAFLPTDHPFEASWLERE